MLPDLFVPHFNKRNHLDKLSNFFANKIFHFLKDPEINRYHSKRNNGDLQCGIIARENVIFNVLNCEYVSKIKLFIRYEYIGYTMTEGEVLFNSPDTINLNFRFPACLLYGGNTLSFGNHRKYLNELYFNLVGTIRHEIQHIIQLFYITISDAAVMAAMIKFYKTNIQDLMLLEEKYFIYPAEMEAFIKSWKLVAKKQNIYWKDFMYKSIDSRAKFLFNIYKNKKEIDKMYTNIKNKILDFASKHKNRLTYLEGYLIKGISPHIY